MPITAEFDVSVLVEENEIRDFASGCFILGDHTGFPTSPSREPQIGSARGQIRRCAARGLTGNHQTATP